MHFRASGTSFLFPETKVLLMNSLNQKRQFFHVIFPVNRLTWRNKFFVNDYLTVEECDQHHFVFNFQIKIFCILESLASAISCFIFLFVDHTENAWAHHPLKLSQARNDHHPQTE
jgi:hypothetical protein